MNVILPVYCLLESIRGHARVFKPKGTEEEHGRHTPKDNDSDDTWSMADGHVDAEEAFSVLETTLAEPDMHRNNE